MVLEAVVQIAKLPINDIMQTQVKIMAIDTLEQLEKAVADGVEVLEAATGYSPTHLRIHPEHWYAMAAGRNNPALIFPKSMTVQIGERWVKLLIELARDVPKGSIDLIQREAAQ